MKYKYVLETRKESNSHVPHAYNARTDGKGYY